jgi:hypothetical protein
MLPSLTILLRIIGFKLNIFYPNQSKIAGIAGLAAVSFMVLAKRDTIFPA